MMTPRNAARKEKSVNLTRSLNRLFVAGATVLLLGAPGLAQAQLGRVNDPGTDLGNSSFDFINVKYGALVNYDVTAALNWDGVSALGAGDLSSRSNTNQIAGIYNATTVLSGVPDPPHATVSVCNDLFNNAADDASNDYYLLDADGNGNAQKIAYLVDNYMGTDGNLFVTNTGGSGVADLNERAAGFQLAVWELWYDDGSDLTTKDLSAGRGFSSSTGGNIKTAADWFLSQANTMVAMNWTSDTALRLLDLADSDGVMQGMLVVSDSPIPEPAFYQMAGLLTMGIIGLRRLRKKAS
jgi:hypothetical protein